MAPSHEKRRSHRPGGHHDRPGTGDAPLADLRISTDAPPVAHGRTRYLPALKYRSLTPLYDPVLRWVFREDAIKRRLVAQAAIRPDQRVLDLGCGTGTLTVMLKRSQPGAVIRGLDGDPDVAMARRKAAAAGLEVSWDLGVADNLPYADGSFDAILASLVLHHLNHDVKEGALREVFRVLRPGGRFLVADFGPPQNSLMHTLAKVSELLEETDDGVEGRLPEMFRRAGLDPVQETERFMTPLGTIAVYEAEKRTGRGPELL